MPDTKMPQTLAIAGQIDRISALFVSLYRHKTKAASPQIVALSETRREDMDDVHWRCGSLISRHETAKMLDGVNVLVYFALTPPLTLRSPQGLEPDVAIASAVSLAQCASAMPGCRVVLVTRYCGENENLPPNYAFWQQITRIFADNCSNLAIIRTMPVLSCDDAVLRGMSESGRNRADAAAGWDNLCAPVAPESLVDSIIHAIQDDSAHGDVVLSGSNSVSYRHLAEIVVRVRRADPIRRLRAAVDPEARTRAQLLDETVRFPTSESRAENIGRDFSIAVEEAFEPLKLRRSMLLRPSSGEKVESSCYAQRVLTNPRRSVSEIADLLMQWLPRYFQRMVRVDNLGGSRLLCRFTRIPLLELEKKQEADNRCRLVMRSPWAHSVQSKTSLTVMTTGNTDNPGELVIVVEDAPGTKLLNMGFRAILHAFGRYLRDYGCGDEIPVWPS